MSSRGKKKLMMKTQGRNNRLKRVRAQSKLSPGFMAAVTIIAVVARMLLTALPSYKIDMGGYRAWSLYLAEKGFDGFYENFHVVYGPAYMYLLWISGLLAKFLSLGQPGHEYLIKMWAVASDFAGSYLIYRIGRKYEKRDMGFILGIIYALNPAIFFNSSVWGQFDSIAATLLMAVIYCFNFKRGAASMVLFTAAVLTKPQSAMIAPIVLVLFFRNFSMRKRQDWLRLFLASCSSLVLYVLIVMPFSSGRPLYWIADLYLKSGGDYPYTTANGFNIWTLLGGQAVNDSTPFLGLTYALWSILLLVCAVFLSLWVLFKKKEGAYRLYYSSYFLCFATFMFGSRMHERYLFPAFIFLFACLLWEARLWAVAVLLSLCHLGNQWYIYELARKEIYWVSNKDATAFVIAVATLAVMVYSIYYLFKMNLEKYSAKKGQGVEAGT